MYPNIAATFLNEQGEAGTEIFPAVIPMSKTAENNCTAC